MPLSQGTLLVASFLLVHHALATDFLGYIAEERSPLTTVACANPDDNVYEDAAEDLIFCDDDGPWIQPVDCRGDILFYVTTLVANADTTSTLTCDGGCVKLSIIGMWPDEGDKSTLYDCITNLVGVEEGVGVQTVYWDVPASFVTQTAGPTAIDPEGDDDDDGGPNIGLIVGASVGGVAGIALIAAGIFLGMRLGKKKAAAQSTSQQGQAKPQPTVTSDWAPAPSIPPPDNAYTVRGASMATPTKSHYSPGPEQQQSVVSPHYSVHSELPSGPHAQRWASNEQHPLPYEMESNTMR